MYIALRLVVVFGIASCSHLGANSSNDEKHDLAVTVDDVRILERADSILANDTIWNRLDTRNCPDNVPKVSLFCALYKASLDVLGAYDHRRTALQEVRFVIGERGKEYEHRLMGFNNDQATTFSDIKQVLHVALERVQDRIKQWR